MSQCSTPQPAAVPAVASSAADAAGTEAEAPPCAARRREKSEMKERKSGEKEGEEGRREVEEGRGEMGRESKGEEVTDLSPILTSASSCCILIKEAALGLVAG